MQSKNKKVLFTAEGGPEARPLYRAKIPAQALFKSGWQARTAEILYEQENHQWNGWNAEDSLDKSIFPAPKFIVVHDMMQPEKGSSPNKLELVWRPQKDVIESIKANGQYVFYDLDDDLWNIPEWSPVYGDKRHSHMDEWIEDINSSDGLIVSTWQIWYSAQKSYIKVPIFICPNSIDYWKYEAHEDHSPLRIGWFGNIEFRGRDLSVAIEDLRRSLRNRRDEVEFWHFGSSFEETGNLRDYLRPFPVDIIERPWVNPEYIQEAIKMVDIGIIPMEQHPFNDGRSNIMGLSFAAGGVPFLASPSKEYLHLDNHLACVTDNFADSLTEIIEDVEYRRSFKKFGPAVVREWYSPKTMAQSWECAFNSVLPKEN